MQHLSTKYFMKLTIALILLLSSINSTYAQEKLKSPEEFLGYSIGESFTHHYQVVDYFNHIASSSNLLTYSSYGTSNEGRELSYAIITSEKNQKSIEQLRKDNLKQTGILDGSASPETAIVWLSYNVHGNEASATEAAMVTAYKLLTTKQDLLENVVVIIDPCVNPDGRDRYVNRYKQVKSSPYSPYQDAVEHHEPWPGGRANHYLFDLNRDWMWATQVETQQRLKLYNKWMPHVHVDFHEQGINSPYYFAPAAKPFHNIITDFQEEFQNVIGKNNAEVFDKKNWAYFTRERFDLFYPSYGDTYPTYNGAIGMTYEQAGNGRAGLGINTDEGYELTLADRVKHHVQTGLTTIKTSSRNAKKLNSEFKSYFDHSTDFDYYVIPGDRAKLEKLSHLFDRHDYKYAFSTEKTLRGNNVFSDNKTSFDAEDAMVIPADQPKSKILEVLFEADPELSTPLTYDITSWNLALAHGLKVYTYSGKVKTQPEVKHKNTIDSQSEIVGYVSPWKSMADAKFLADLLKQNISVRASTKPFKIENESYDRGSLILTKTNNQSADFDSLVIATARRYNIELDAVETGFSDSGTDFGSPDVKKIHPQRIALLRGKGTSSLSYGSLWHFFEQELSYPIISVSTKDYDSISLKNYDVLILPKGKYSTILDKKELKSLKSWIKKGGKVIAIGSALSHFEGKEDFGLKKIKVEKDSTKTNLIAYAKRKKEKTKKKIKGAIFKVKVDNTHPLAFGYNSSYATLKTSSKAYKYLNEGFNVVYFDESSERLSGFAGQEAEEKMSNSLVFGEQRIGKGSIIYMVDDVMFRSFWENGKLFFVNALFMVNNRSQEFR